MYTIPTNQCLGVFMWDGGRSQAGTYFLVAPGPRIHSYVSAPSFVEKKAPHLGHLIQVSLGVDAHPKEKDITIDRTMKIFILFSILNPPYWKSCVYRE